MKHNLFLVAVGAMIPGRTVAFAPSLTNDASQRHGVVSSSSWRTRSTELQAMPVYIIGPMIKRFRDAEAKKRMPLADAEEAAVQAPGLRVGRDAWKWPQIWPYDDSFFTPLSEADAMAAKQRMTGFSDLAGMITGAAVNPDQPPAAEEVKAEEEEEDLTFNALKYWGEDQADTKTVMDDEQIEKLQAHFAFYLRDGMDILELGAAENSYLPKSLRPGRHVGVSANEKLMSANPALTDRLVVDLNKVVPDRDVDNDDFRRLAKQPFDAVIMTNTIDYLRHPREVFRSAWYLLKPGGIMIVAFQGREASKDQFSEAQTKIWRQYNDDQHIWITGSFFQFSAGDGWENLFGFDISPESAKETSDNPVLKLLNPGKSNNVYVVQAIKGFQDECIDPENAERSIRSLCWMLPVLEARDKNLVVPRLARAYDIAESDQVKQAIERNIPTLPAIYECLIKMDQFSFTFSMQAQMAAELVTDPAFTASEEQILALKQGLGLRTPSAEFWAPVGQTTNQMAIEDKINLLGHLVPCFGSGDPEQEAALQDFVTGIKPTYAVIRLKCPDMPESDVQLLGTELLAAEILKPGRSTREQYAIWLNAMTATEMQDIVSKRKELRQKAKTDLEEYKKQKEEDRKRREEYKRKMDEQIAAARQERSLVFNPKTEKMEVFDNPNKKK